MYLYLIACLKTDSSLCFLLIAFVQYETDKLLEKESYANPRISPSRNTPRYKIHMIYVGIDQACSLDGCLLAKFFFCMFVDQDGVEIYKHTKKRTGQYPAILTKQASSVKRLYYMEKEHYLCGTVVKIAPCCPLR